jgi:beta-lactamase regulating signal transducer with metallopeptidase domain
MTDGFLTILNMSLTAGYVILFILLIRLPLKKASKVISYALWSVVAFRLLCPFSFESILSLIPMNTSPIPQNILYQQTPQINSGITAVDSFVNRSLPVPVATQSANPLQTYAQIGSCIWLLGIAVMIIYSVVSVLLLKSSLKRARFLEGNLYEADNLKTPFVLGIFRPRIFIPAGLSKEEKSYIIRHEQIHIHRLDHIIKPFAFLVLSIHWFNPLVWIAFVLMSTDMELSCDERVLKEMGGDIKKAYSASLLSLATEKRIINGSPIAFGEGNVRGRIKNVLNYKRPAFWAMTAAVIAVICVGVGLMANPKETAASKNNSLGAIYYQSEKSKDDPNVYTLTAVPQTEYGYTLTALPSRKNVYILTAVPQTEYGYTLTALPNRKADIQK